MCHYPTCVSRDWILLFVLYLKYVHDNWRSSYGVNSYADSIKDDVNSKWPRLTRSLQN